MIAFLRPGDAFPPVESALREPDGLLCAGADLSPARLLEAYRQGIFPWFSRGQPILWWSPDPRMVLRTAEFRVSRSLAKNRRNRGYAVRVDTAFAQVLEECAAPRDGESGTWLGAEMRAAYSELHRLGHAHSVETWHDGRLVGGLYGVALGRMFFGESMFSRATDASKVALAALVDALRACDWPLVDCQVHTPLLESLGARAIPRREFLRALSPLVNYRSPPEPWNLVAA